MAKSLLDHAYDFVSQSEAQVSFQDMWAYIVKAAELSEEEAAKRIGRFYTNLMLDGRFVTLGENQWDLRVRHTFDKVHIDMKDVYADTDNEDVDIEEVDEEEKAYREAFDEPKDEDESDEESEESSDEDQDL